MGGGVSRRALLQHSDSRLEALRAESRNSPDDDRLLDLAPIKVPPGLRVEVGSLRRLSGGQLKPYSDQRWCHEATATLREEDLPVNFGAEGDQASEKRLEEEGEDGYSTDDFEDDEILEWKKGASIGAGSYGTVYLARDEETGSLMAVKEILISDESEFAIREATREVELLRSLKHEHIVKYLGCHVDNEAQTLSIFTEWVPGGSLEHNRKLFGGNERVVRRFTQQLLSGVAYLHSKSIIHQDIKPTNILVDQNGVVKIADFGASRLINSATSTSASPSSRSLRGTPNYMAPEAIRQTTGRSRKADIWSIGCTVLRLLTGRPLWGDRRFDSQAALLYYVAHLEVLPPLPDDISPEAHEFISACLQLDPAMRPSAAELLTFPFIHHGGHKPEPVAPEQVVTPRRHTAPATSPTSASRRPKLSGHQHEADVNEGVDVPNSPVKRVSLVATLFTPCDVANTNTPEDVPESEMAGENAAVSILSRGSYTSDFASSTLALTASRGEATTRSENNSDLVMTHWDDEPILTSAARREREKREADLVESTRRRQERERRFQEELAAYRRESFAGQT